jgi:hypothetical protein
MNEGWQHEAATLANRSDAIAGSLPPASALNCPDERVNLT